MAGKSNAYVESIIKSLDQHLMNGILKGSYAYPNHPSSWFTKTLNRMTPEEKGEVFGYLLMEFERIQEEGIEIKYVEDKKEKAKSHD